jgi:hypothetical protein
MPFPNFDFCLICEGIRPEVGGKLTILGFYGVAPNVEVVISNPDQPLMLAFIAGVPPVATLGVYHNVIMVTRPNGAVALQTPPSPLNVSQTGRGIIGSSFVLPPPHSWGKHQIRVFVNNEMKLDTSFTLRQPSPSELANLGGVAFTPPAGRPN